MVQAVWLPPLQVVFPPSLQVARSHNEAQLVQLIRAGSKGMAPVSGQHDLHSLASFAAVCTITGALAAPEGCWVLPLPCQCHHAGALHAAADTLRQLAEGS